MLKHSLTIALVTLVCVACTNERTPASTTACLDYAVEIQPALSRACLECHGPELVEGDYSVATRAGTFARRPADGTARIEANNDALFLLAARGEIIDHPRAEPADLALFEHWLIDCQANTLRTESTHPRGWLNADSIDFHGTELQESGWDFGACKECHGKPDDPMGGDSGISCTRCHTEGATGCSTCHGVAASEGAPGPALDGSTQITARGVGAHRIHQSGRLLAASVQCEDCHVVPENWDDPGHILTADGNVDEVPAEVVFGAAAGRSLKDVEQRRTAEPSYDVTTGTCSNIYCHAAVVGDTTYSAPVWTEISDDPECDTCHGFPPSTHAEGTVAADCVVCHPLVIGTQTGPSSFELLDQSLHIDGQLSLGDGSGSCSLCHGSPTNSAPPRGLGGETSTDDPQVGAHQAHVAASTFRGPIPCNDCHVMPSGTSYIGAVLSHIDSAAEVFPAGLGGIASTDGATPVYTRPNCANAYCHGGGLAASTDTAAGIVRTLDWTDVGNSTVICGSCHGLPPQNARHPQNIAIGVPIAITDCEFCHGGTIDASGAIRFDANGNSNHIDGVVGP